MSIINAEAEIRELIDQWARALEARDLDRMFENYAPGAVLFDAIPPYKTVGVENIRRAWESCMPYFPEEFRSEHHDLEVTVDGDVAFVYGLHHFVANPPDHPCAQSWMRVTVCYRRIDGRWKVVHEHVSMPFNPMNNQVWFIGDPADTSAPDYSNASGEG